MDSARNARPRPTGCEIDVPTYVFRSGMDLAFRLWLQVDEEPPRQLYHSFRHCVPLAAGSHRIRVRYGDAWRGGLAEHAVELDAGQVIRIRYAPPAALMVFWWAATGSGTLKPKRVTPSFGPEAWQRQATGPFAEATLLPLWPFAMGGGVVAKSDRERQAKTWELIRCFQHEPLLNIVIGSASLLALFGAALWIGRGLTVGGASVLGLLFIPLVVAIIAWAVGLFRYAGGPVRPRKLAALAALLALTFLQMGGLSQGWGLPSAEERKTEKRLEALRARNEASVELGEGKQLAREGNLAGAIAHLRRARELRLDDAETRIALADALVQTGLHDEAMREVIAAFQWSPESAARDMARRPVLVRAIQYRDAFQALRSLHPEIDRQLENADIGGSSARDGEIL